MPKSVTFDKSVNPVTLKLVHSGDTKSYRRFQITRDMQDAARENGVKEEQVRLYMASVYADPANKDFKSADAIYVTITAVPPKGFVDHLAPVGDDSNDDDDSE